MWLIRDERGDVIGFGLSWGRENGAGERAGTPMAVFGSTGGCKFSATIPLLGPARDLYRGAGQGQVRGPAATSVNLRLIRVVVIDRM